MKIIQEYKKCIGCGSCSAVCAKYFEMKDDGAVRLKGGQEAGEKLELETENPGCAKEAEEICPVQAIRVEK